MNLTATDSSAYPAFGRHVRGYRIDLQPGVLGAGGCCGRGGEQSRGGGEPSPWPQPCFSKRVAVPRHLLLLGVPLSRWPVAAASRVPTPGDLLFMPAGWVHFVAAGQAMSVSLNVWSLAFEGKVMQLCAGVPLPPAVQGVAG